MIDYSKKLANLQWITNNAQFNVEQHIKLGEAIAGFNDCIEELATMKIAYKKLKESNDFYMGDSYGEGYYDEGGWQAFPNKKARTTSQHPDVIAADKLMEN